MTLPLPPPPVIPDPRRNRRVAMISGGVVVAMVGLAYASVPLYRAFCQATGFAGTTQRAEQAPAKAGDRTVTVRFDSNVSSNLSWSFTPEQLEQTVKIGEQTMAFFRATNTSNRETTGTASVVRPVDATGLGVERVNHVVVARNEDTTERDRRLTRHDAAIVLNLAVGRPSY